MSSEVADLKRGAERLFAAQHPGLSGYAPRDRGDLVFGEIAIRSGAVATVGLEPRGSLTIRQWLVGTEDERYPTKHGIVIPAEAMPRFAVLIAQAMESLAITADNKPWAQQGPSPPLGGKELGPSASPSGRRGR